MIWKITIRSLLGNMKFIPIQQINLKSLPILGMLMIFMLLGSGELNAQSTPDLRDCDPGFNCTSNNFTLDDVYLTLVDQNGDEINPKSCASGQVIKAKVMLNYTSNASNTINSTRVFADLLIGDESVYINKYLGDVPGKGVPQEQEIYPNGTATVDTNPDGTFNWVCGTELRLEDILVVWRTGGSGNIENNYNCGSYSKSQCEFPAPTIVAAPLAVQFDYTVCRENGTTTVNYTSTTNGGIKPYTVEWDFTNDGTIDFTSVIQEGSDGGSTASFSTTSTSDFTTRLRVTDSDSPNTTSSFFETVVNPSELSISESITNIGCDETGTGAIDITVTGGTGDYSYSWTGPDFSSADEDLANLDEGTYSVTVTDVYNCTISATYEVDKVLPPSEANAGGDQSKCNTSEFTLAATAPSVGTGTWTVVSGTADIDDPDSPTSTASVNAGESAILRWTITNGSCTTSDEVELINYSEVIADAGEYQSQCDNSSFTLDGNTPSAGTGEWTVVNGSANIADSDSPNSTVSVEAGVAATLRWTITNGDCSDFDEVTIENFEDVTADAGEDQSKCNNSSFSLDGNVPTAGTGEWTLTSGSATITDPDSATSEVIVEAGNTAILRWTITNGDCSDYDEVTIENFEDVTADAGEDQSNCNNSSFTLAGNSPAAGNGVWTVESGSATIASPNSPTSGVTVETGNSATLRWTITNGDCSAYDEVFIENYVLPDAPVSGGNETVCAFDPLQTITATATVPDGFSIQWYENASGGDPVTPTLNEVGTVTYYAEAVNDITDCVSASRTAVSLEILPEITLSAVPNTVSCTGEQDGEISITNSENSSVTIYNSSNVDVTANNGALPAGIYLVVASESSNETDPSCTKEVSVNIEVRDNNAPQISVPPSLELEVCDAQDITAQNARFPLDEDGSSDIKDSFEATGYSASDDQDIVSITYTDNVSFESGCRPVITRTFFVTDNCGSQDSASITISLIDDTAPEFNETLPQAEITVECDDVPDAAILTASDNCSDEIEVDYSEEIIGNDDNCSNVYTITRTWNAQDCSGNPISHTQLINVIDTSAPVFDQELPEPEITVECDEVPDAHVFTATDSCSGSIDVVFTEETTGLDDNCANEYTIIRSWTATDCADNESTFTQTINVIDTEAPEFVEELPETEITVECDNIPDAVSLTAIDNCSSDIGVIYSEEISGQDEDCANEYIITRTWTATDCAENETSFTQTINVIDTAAPVFAEELPAAELSVECDNIPEPMTLTASDNCSGLIDVVFSQEISGQDDDCANVYMITRTWTATDCAMNETSFTQVINVIDTTAPEFNEAIPANMSIECENFPDPPVITASDNCDPEVEVIFSEISDKENEEDKEYVLTRTWTATDCAGNEVSASQTITVQNTGAPSFNENLPSDVTVECDSVPEAPVITATDNCVSELEVVFTEEFNGLDDECANEYSITRTWTATDDANNVTSHTQVITVEDSTAPIFNEELPASGLISECDQVPAAVELTATDNCSGDVQVSFEEIISNKDSEEDFNYNIQRIWTALDCAGNETSVIQEIEVMDTTPPILISCPETLTVEADMGVCTASEVELGMPGATDNCSSAESLTITNDAPEEFPLGETTVTWTIEDSAGNTTTCEQIVNVIDTQSPVITECASDLLNVEADSSNCVATGVELGMPAVTDNCTSLDELTITNDAPGEFPIGETIVTWTITDAAGNETSCTQMIMVADTQAPVISECAPEIVEVSADEGLCSASGVDLGMPNVSDNCTAEVSITNDAPDVFELGDTTVTWTISDEAGNTTTCTQIVTVIDDQDPQMETMDNIVVDSDAGSCGAVVEYGMIGASDNCELDSVELTEGLASGSEFPVGTTTVTYTATDTAGNTSTSSFTVTVEDNEAPSIECPTVDTLIVEIGTTSAVVNYDAVVTTDNCEGTTVELIEGFASGEEFPLGETIVTYRVTDDAGNSTECSFTVVVEEEELPDPPAIPSASVSTAATCTTPTGTITVETQQGLTYSIDGENYQASGVFEGLEPGTYQVTAKDEYGQVSQAASVTIEAPVAEEIEVVQGSDLCNDGTDPAFDLFSLLVGEVDESGTWIDTENTGALDNEFVDPAMLAAGTYTFTYQLEGNCPSTTDVTLTIVDCVVLDCSIEELRDSISKAVTPNGDNRNDFFTVDLDSECGFTYDLMIFNRWGAKVFDARNYQNNWDGYAENSTLGSNQLPSGTYYYVLTVRNSSFEPIQGYIYLGTK